MTDVIGMIVLYIAGLTLTAALVWFVWDYRLEAAFVLIVAAMFLISWEFKR